jgi:hypothetical protein
MKKPETAGTRKHEMVSNPCSSCFPCPLGYCQCKGPNLRPFYVSLLTLVHQETCRPSLHQAQAVQRRWVALRNWACKFSRQISSRYMSKANPPLEIMFPLRFSSSRYSSIVIVGNRWSGRKTSARRRALSEEDVPGRIVNGRSGCKELKFAAEKSIPVKSYLSS